MFLEAGASRLEARAGVSAAAAKKKGMPAAKATSAKPAVEAAETEEELAAALSALLKKGHAARTNALLKDDCELSQHIIREAERAGLDANMLLAVYMATWVWSRTFLIHVR